MKTLNNCSFGYLNQLKKRLDYLNDENTEELQFWLPKSIKKEIRLSNIESFFVFCTIADRCRILVFR